MSRSARALAALAAVGVVVLGVVVVLAATGRADWSLVLLVLVAGLSVLALGLGVVADRRAQARTRRLERLVERLVERSDQRTERRVESLRGDVTQVGRSVAAVGDAADQYRASQRSRPRADFAQVEALLTLRDLCGVADAGVPMPALRGWAAAPTSLLEVVRAVIDTRPDLVVECGSGSSSVWVGHLLRRLGHGRIVSLDHEEEYADITRRDLERHGLSDLVEVRHAPLVPVHVDGEDFSWYDPAQIADLSGIGVVFVDGPPGATGPQARFPAVPMLMDKCVPGAVVVLDDAARKDERALSKRWVAAGATVVDQSQWEKGTRVFTLGTR